MSSNIEETVLEKMRTLAPEQQRAVLDFVENLAQKKATGKKSVWEEIREIVKDVPDEVWEQIPQDGSEQHDHYLYGAPKK